MALRTLAERFVVFSKNVLSKPNVYLAGYVVKFEQMVAVEAIFAPAVVLEVAYFVLVSVVEAGESKVAVRLTSIEVQFLR